MARVKVVVRKKPKKGKTETKNQLVPRLRLEPRINSKKNTTNNDEQLKIDNNKQLNGNVCEEVKNDTDINKSNKYTQLSLQKEKNTNLMRNEIPENIQTEAVTCETLPIFSVFNTDVIEHPPHHNKHNQNINRVNFINNLISGVNPRKKRAVPGSRSWSDRELMDLTAAFQIYGMGEYQKIAEFIKTKDENAIRDYLRSNYIEYSRRKNAGKGTKPLNSWFKPNITVLQTWPNLRKWRKMAFNQMQRFSRSKDYSIPVMRSLCKKFYEEAEEISDPQVIDVKSIYKYMLDCVVGNIPAQLPPKESALVLELQKEVKFMSLQYNFEEEIKFLKNFKTAIKFKPFEVKSEFKKKFEQKESVEMDDNNTVPVPEEVFLELSRHKKLVQSLNPLMTPIWMLQKEQEYLKNYIEESMCK